MSTGVRMGYSLFSSTDANTVNMFISSNIQSQEDYKTDGKDCDVSIVVEGRKVKANKAVLAASIPYFHSMFMLGMQESTMDEVDIPDIGIKFRTMEQLIEYAYTGKMEITTDNVQSIITSAHYLQLTDLVDYCSWFLIRHMNNSNCFELRRLFERLALDNYNQIATGYIRSSFLSISKQDGFIELDIDELVELLSCDQLYTDNEYDVLDRSMLWLRAKQGREQYIDRISQCIRIPSANQLIMSLMDDSASSLPCQIDTTRRPYKQWILTVAGSGSPQRVQIYDPTFRRYQLIKDMIIQQRGEISSILYHKRQVIIVFNSLFHPPSVEIFDLDTRKWTQLLPVDRHIILVRSVIIDNKLYLIGSEFREATEPEIFDFETQQWSRGQRMTEYCSNPDKISENQKVAAVGKYIYVINLTPSTGLTNCVERYDTEQNRWEFVAPMLTDKDKVELIAHEGKIYVAGEVEGRDGTVTRTMEVYDPDTNTWSELTTNYQPISISSLVSTHEGIYAVAVGLHLYNVEKNEWSHVNKMVSGFGLSCAVPVSPYGK